MWKEGRGGGKGKGCAERGRGGGEGKVVRRGVERGRRRIEEKRGVEGRRRRIEEKEGCWRGVEGKEKYQVNECTAAVDYFVV